jgi:hypothetical protein
MQNTCMNATVVLDREDSIEESVYGISTRARPVEGIEDIGVIHAVSVETGKTIWTYEQRAGVLSLLTTGGGLVFGGDANGRFRALDDMTGKVLWEINLGAPVSGFPVTFAVQGTQYVAVSTGPSLVAAGTMALTPELSVGSGANLFVFALPD